MRTPITHHRPPRKAHPLKRFFLAAGMVLLEGLAAPHCNLAEARPALKMVSKLDAASEQRLVALHTLFMKLFGGIEAELLREHVDMQKPRSLFSQLETVYQQLLGEWERSVGYEITSQEDSEKYDLYVKRPEKLLSQLREEVTPSALNTAEKAELESLYAEFNEIAAPLKTGLPNYWEASPKDLEAIETLYQRLKRVQESIKGLFDSSVGEPIVSKMDKLWHERYVLETDGVCSRVGMWIDYASKELDRAAALPITVLDASRFKRNASGRLYFGLDRNSYLRPDTHDLLSKDFIADPSDKVTLKLDLGIGMLKHQLPIEERATYNYLRLALGFQTTVTQGNSTTTEEMDGEETTVSYSSKAGGSRFSFGLSSAVPLGSLELFAGVDILPPSPGANSRNLHRYWDDGTSSREDIRVGEKEAVSFNWEAGVKLLEIAQLHHVGSTLPWNPLELAVDLDSKSFFIPLYARSGIVATVHASMQDMVIGTSDLPPHFETATLRAVDAIARIPLIQFSGLFELGVIGAFQGAWMEIPESAGSRVVSNFLFPFGINVGRILSSGLEIGVLVDLTNRAPNLSLVFHDAESWDDLETAASGSGVYYNYLHLSPNLSTMRSSMTLAYR